jgi:hypothetical protein
LKRQANHILFALACLALAGVLAACGSPSSAPEPSQTPAPAASPLAQASQTPLPTKAPTAGPSQAPAPTLPPTVPPTPDAAELRTRVIDALLALNLKSNRMDVTTVLSGSETRMNTIEFVPPDRKRIVDDAADVEYIVVGDTVYARTAGKWAKTEIPASTFMGEGQTTAETLDKTVGAVQVRRQETLDGRALVVYAYYSTTTAGDLELHSYTELWVGVDDGLPYKMVTNGEIPATSVDPATGESKLNAVQAQTTTIIEFDPAIAIEAPIP